MNVVLGVLSQVELEKGKDVFRNLPRVVGL
jgi:hypothetical protein